MTLDGDFELEGSSPLATADAAILVRLIEEVLEPRIQVDFVT